MLDYLCGAEVNFKKNSKSLSSVGEKICGVESSKCGMQIRSLFLVLRKGIVYVLVRGSVSVEVKNLENKLYY